MKIRLFFISFIMILSCICTSCSSDDGSGKIMKFYIDEDPQSFDPQTSEDYPSLTIMKNMYQGLVELNENGEIIPAAAKDYSVSDNGLTYTFYLRDDLYWKGANTENINLTADDFVFAFQRLADPKTKSPYAQNYYCIDNFENANNGLTSVKQIGVYAKDKYTLQITLKHSDTEFLYILTMLSSMPCNEEFFNSTNGQYGLESEFTISNGPFYVTKWLYDPYGSENYVILRKNTNYEVVKKVIPSGLNYFTTRSKDKQTSGFVDNKVDCILDNGQTSEIYNKDTSSILYCTKAAGLMFNPQNELININEVKQALVLSTDFSKINISDKNITFSKGLIPSSVMIDGKQFREYSPTPAVNNTDLPLGQYIWLGATTTAQKNELNSSSILVPESFKYNKYLNEITKQWIENLNFYCAVEVVPDKEYYSRIKAGKYSIALVEIDADFNSPYNYLSQFTTESSKNITGFSNEMYDNIILNSRLKTSHEATLNEYINAEKFLINNFVFIPFFEEYKYLVYSKDVSGIKYDPFTQYIDFSEAKK